MARGRKPIAPPNTSEDDLALLVARVGAAAKNLTPADVAEKKRRIDAFKPFKGDVASQLEVVTFMEPFLMASDLRPTAVTNVLRMIPRTGCRQLRVGLPLTLRSLIGVDAVNQFFIAEGSHYGELTSARIRSAASQLGRAARLLPDYPPLQRTFPRTKRDAPYTAQLIDEYLDQVRHAPEPLRVNALTLVHLAAAGVHTTAIQVARGTDVTRLGDQTVIWLPSAGGYGLRRLVGDAAQFIAERAEAVGNEHLLRPGMARTPSVEEVVSALHQHLDLPRFRVQRAVDRWLVEILNDLGYSEFMQLTGLMSPSHTINDLKPYLAPATTERCIELLVSTTNHMNRLTEQ